MTNKNGKTNGKRAEHDETREANGHWKPGHCPNPSGRPKGRFDFRAALDRHIAETGLDIDKAAGELADSLFNKAMEGDTTAAKLWLDRCYGIQRQQIDLESTSVVYHSDKDKAAMVEMAANPENQAVMRAELVRRTNGKA